MINGQLHAPLRDFRTYRNFSGPKFRRPKEFARQVVPYIEPFFRIQPYDPFNLGTDVAVVVPYAALVSGGTLEAYGVSTLLAVFDRSTYQDANGDIDFGVDATFELDASGFVPGSLEYTVSAGDGTSSTGARGSVFEASVSVDDLPISRSFHMYLGTWHHPKMYNGKFFANIDQYWLGDLDFERFAYYDYGGGGVLLDIQYTYYIK